MEHLDLVIAVVPRLLGDVLARALRSEVLSVRVWDQDGEVEAEVVLVNDEVPPGVRGDLVVRLPPVPGEPARVEGPLGSGDVYLSSLEELRTLLGTRFQVSVGE